MTALCIRLKLKEKINSSREYVTGKERESKYGLNRKEANRLLGMIFFKKILERDGDKQNPCKRGSILKYMFSNKRK